MESKQIKFELKRLTNYSDDAIIAELRRVAKIVRKPILTRENFVQHSRVHSSTVEKRFGGWANALLKADLKHLLSQDALIIKISNEEIINELKMVAMAVGSNAISNTHIKQLCKVSRTTLKTRFGSWQKAVEAAGLIPVTHSDAGKRYSDDECFENLLKVWTYYGRPPKYKEMSLSPSTVGGKAYMLRFGSWNKALIAFVEKINGNSSEMSVIVARSKDASLESSWSRMTSRDKRDISLGLRFKIFHRDNFRCVLCGASPATHLGCDLHVDHVIPWSKGGKTQEDNLRSLCGACNIGRGNRYEK